METNFIRDQSIQRPASPRHPCQLASPSVFMPARRVSARLFQTFHPHHLPADWSVCRPKSPPAQRAQWSPFWAAKLSGLTAPIGPTSLPDRGECLDRQILAAMRVKPGVCVCRPWTHAHANAIAHSLGPSEDLSGRIVLSGERARGKILAVTPHAHWGTLMGEGGAGKRWVFGCKFNQRGSVITQLRFEPDADTHTWLGKTSKKKKGWAMATKCARRMGLLMPLEMKQEVKTLTNNSAAPTAVGTHRREGPREILSRRECLGCVVFFSTPSYPLQRSHREPKHLRLSQTCLSFSGWVMIQQPRTQRARGDSRSIGAVEIEFLRYSERQLGSEDVTTPCWKFEQLLMGNKPPRETRNPKKEGRVQNVVPVVLKSMRDAWRNALEPDISTVVWKTTPHRADEPLFFYQYVIRKASVHLIRSHTTVDMLGFSRFQSSCQHSLVPKQDSEA